MWFGLGRGGYRQGDVFASSPGTSGKMRNSPEQKIIILIPIVGLASALHTPYSDDRNCFIRN
jgi:hypothetical protein